MERFVPTWMKSAPISAARKVSTLNVPSVAASAVPTSTGATAAGSVRGRAAISQILAADGRSVRRSRPARELGEVGRPLLLVGVAALRGLLAAVEEEVRVVRELLEAGVAVLVRR